MKEKKMVSSMTHGVVVHNGVVTKVGRSTIYQPKTKFKGGTIPFYDDTKLLKKNRRG